MIIVKLHGGLGNQLFEYAAGRRLAEKHKTILKLDISSLQQAETKRHFDLGHFNIQAEIAKHEEIAYISTIGTSWRRRLLWNVSHMCGIAPLYFYREKNGEFEPGALRLSDNTYMYGQSLSEKNFKDIEPIIRKEFVVKTPQTGPNADMAQKISETNSVSMHIRRTDYVNNEAYKKIYNVCDLPYYERAVEYISSKINNPTFFIFSDDIPWTKENMKIPFPTVFVDINDDTTNYEDLRLMSQCKHNIIANSSFSWWGAWLNQNPEKIVVAPQRWFAIDVWDTKDVTPSTWVKI